MKTLDAKALKARKDNLQAEFDREKEAALKWENVLANAAQRKQLHLDRMANAQAAFAEIERLEKTLGIDPLSTRPVEKSTGKK